MDEEKKLASSPTDWSLLDTLSKVMIAAIGAVGIAGLAAGTQLWAMPFPRVAFMTMATAFGLATMWATGLYLSVKFIASRGQPKAGVSFAKRSDLIASVFFTALSVIFLTWHLISGARAIGDVRWCLHNATAWQCNVTYAAATPDQKKALERLLAPYKTIHWGAFLSN